MDLIQQFIDTYKMKWTFYDAAGRLAAEKLQLALQNAGIRAIVTSRAKNPARLRTKVQRRNSRREEPYQTLEEIYDDIADLSGVRVSLYFPGDRGKVDAIISELFNILEFKQFPEQSKPQTSLVLSNRSQSSRRHKTLTCKAGCKVRESRIVKQEAA